MCLQAVAGEDVLEDEEMLGGKDAAVKAAAKGKLLSHIVKRNVMQVGWMVGSWASLRSN